VVIWPVTTLCAAEAGCGCSRAKAPSWLLAAKRNWSSGEDAREAAQRRSLQGLVAAVAQLALERDALEAGVEAGARGGCPAGTR